MEVCVGGRIESTAVAGKLGEVVGAGHERRTCRWRRGDIKYPRQILRNCNMS